MRNFFKNTWGPETNLESKRQLSEILDTDEDTVLNQYRRYLNYINKVKRGLVQKSDSIVRETRNKYLKHLHLQ